MVAGEATELCG